MERRFDGSETAEPNLFKKITSISMKKAYFVLLGSAQLALT